MFQEMSFKSSGGNGKPIGYNFTGIGTPNLVTARLGGVSSYPYNTLNLGFRVGDAGESVITNREIAAKMFGDFLSNFVFANQNHGNCVIRVDHNYNGAAAYGAEELPEADGLVTNSDDVVLGALSADCPVVAFYDPTAGTAGLAHSGWRGTVGDIVGKVIYKMRFYFGSKPQNIRAAIGPRICQDCYEIGGDALRDFQRLFRKNGMGDRMNECISPKGAQGKRHLDLGKTIVLQLVSAGVREDQIEMANKCTKCQENLFFSHRGIKEKEGREAETGGFGTFIAL